MIIVRIFGGLGNQLFQYATAYAISKKLNRKLLIDDSWYQIINMEDELNNPNTTTKRRFLLNNFKIDYQIINRLHLNWIKRLKIKSRDSSFYKFLSENPLKILSYHHINHTNFSLKVIDDTPRIYLHGYWQNNDILEDYRNSLLKEFSLKYPMSTVNKKYLDTINSTHSVAIHFRRGDYLNNPNSRNVHTICSNTYYKNAIKHIQNKSKDTHLFVFSDDIEWVKNNFDYNTNMTYINNDGPEYEHLVLMSQCKHQITANSTFSWWGAWLNQYPEKIIITPKDWYHDTTLNESVIRIPDNWIKIANN